MVKRRVKREWLTVLILIHRVSSIEGSETILFHSLNGWLKSVNRDMNEDSRFFYLQGSYIGEGDVTNYSSNFDFTTDSKMFRFWESYEVFHSIYPRIFKTNVLITLFLGTSIYVCVPKENERGKEGREES